MPSCLRLLVHCERRADSRAACTAGRSRAIRTAMIEMTTRSSIRVKPRRLIGGTPRARGAGIRRLRTTYMTLSPSKDDESVANHHVQGVAMVLDQGSPIHVGQQGSTRKFKPAIAGC